MRLEERHFGVLQRAQTRRRLALAASVGVTLHALLALVGAVWDGGLQTTSPTRRTLDVYVYTAPEYPALDRLARDQGVAIAMQSFQDHFGLSLGTVNLHEGELPGGLERDFEENLPKLTRYPTWERELIPRFQKDWERDPSAPLPVVVTNIPIFVDSRDVQIETRHLSDSKLVSGLGHPALVVISTYRMLTEDPALKTSRFQINNETDQTRHLGEYLIAHELGHALIGLSDFVVPKLVSSSVLRAPASTESFSHCLMHTDEAGGFEAWRGLKDRPLRTPASCSAYVGATEAHQRHLVSLELLKEGRREEAEIAHSEAIIFARTSLLPWVAAQWSDEHDAFLSLGARWMKRILMLQSKHDQF